MNSYPVGSWEQKFKICSHNLWLQMYDMEENGTKEKQDTLTSARNQEIMNPNQPHLQSEEPHIFSVFTSLAPFCCNSPHIDAWWRYFCSVIASTASSSLFYTIHIALHQNLQHRRGKPFNQPNRNLS
ncbi:hypothetical protein Pfo_009505 [Paulownia fortunei]|nr:hypothetical protein Pfo_009505 [Paulownia fortunei]